MTRQTILLALFFFSALILAPSFAAGFQEDSFCTPNTDCQFSFQVRNFYEQGQIYNGLSCEISFYHQNATLWKNASMSSMPNGFYTYNLNTGNTGTYFWSVECMNSTTGNVKGAKNGIIKIKESVSDNLKSLENTTKETANNVADIKKTTAKIHNTTSDIKKNTSETLKQIDKKTEIQITDYHEVRQGNKYRLTVSATEFSGSTTNLGSPPEVTIYDPERNKLVDSIATTKKSKGVYVYSFNTSSGMTGGVYETSVNTSIGGSISILTDYWELESSPAQVKINKITDKTPPNIAANITITNEGNSDYEYQYEYCAVKKQDNLCGGGDDLDYASGAKLIKTGESWMPELELDEVDTDGDAWFKLVVYWGSEKSGASQSFTLEKTDSSTETTSSSSSGGSSSTPTASIPKQDKETRPNISVISAHDNVFVQKDGSGNAVVALRNTGDDSANVSIGVEGLLFSWFDIKTDRKVLEPGETGEFRIKFQVPGNTSVGNYSFRYVVNSENVIKKDAELTVLEDREHVLAAQIAYLKEENRKIWSSIRSNKVDRSIPESILFGSILLFVATTGFLYMITRRTRKMVENLEDAFYTQITQGTVNEAKEKIKALDSPNYQELLEKEEHGKDRKTLENYLRKKLGRPN